MNIIIPAAGNGLRFYQEGYERKKPFIETSTYGDIPMIARVLESLRDLEFFNAKLILIMQKDHLDNGFCSNMREWLDGVIRCYWKGYYKIVEINGPTSGAVSTTLSASKYLMNDEELIIANSDQVADCDFINFINYARDFDGCLLTFRGDGDPKWSFCQTGEYNGVKLVDRVAEKEPLEGFITNTGIYYFKTGFLYLNAAISMIEKNIRTNGEIYVAPVYNELCRTHCISYYNILESNFFGMGTPSDLLQTIERKRW